MGYNIAVASTDGINIDKHFGASDSFFIIKVNDDGTYENLGERVVKEGQNNNTSTVVEALHVDILAVVTVIQKFKKK